MEEVRTCTKCKAVKPIASFSKNKSNASGYNHWCRECRLGYNYRLIHGNREQAEHRQLTYMLHNSKRRATQRGLEHNITLDYLRTLVRDYCPYLGVQLNWESQAGSDKQVNARANSPSLDRIDSSKGYVEGNVVIASFRANTIKNNANERELLRMGRCLAQLKMEMAIPE